VSEMVEQQSVALPHDYDARWSVEGANTEIENLLRQVIAAKDAERIAALAEKQEEYRQRAEAAEATISEMRIRAEEAEAKIEDLEKINDKVNETNEALTSMIHDLQLERDDALQKRDNAVRMAEEAQEARKAAEQDAERLRGTVKSLEGQINELEAMLQSFKANKPSVGGLQLTSTLPALSEDEKARRDREQKEFINRRLSEKFGGAVKPLDVPPLPSAEKAAEPAEEDVTEDAVKAQMERVEEAAAAAEATFPVVPSEPGADPAAGGAEEATEAARAADAKAVPTLEVLAAKVASLESWQMSVEERIVGLTSQR